MENEKNLTILPCPFCGSEAETESRTMISEQRGRLRYKHTNWIVRCGNMECFMHGLRMSAFMDDFFTEEEAVEAWNERAAYETD